MLLSVICEQLYNGNVEHIIIEYLQMAPVKRCGVLQTQLFNFAWLLAFLKVYVWFGLADYVS